MAEKKFALRSLDTGRSHEVTGNENTTAAMVWASEKCWCEASHDWKSQAPFHGLTRPCWAEPVKRRFPVAVFRYPPCARQHREFFSFRGNGLPFHHTGSSQLAVTPSAAGVSPCSSAMSLISVDKVFVLLWASSGTFAVTACPTVAGRVFKRSRIKYRAPML